MAECRSLIEFLRAFEHHRRVADNAAAAAACSRSRRPSSPSTSLTAFCEHSPMAAVDAVALLAVVGALGFLVVPYAKMALVEMGALLHPAAPCLSAAGAAFAGAAVAGATAVLAWEMLGHHARKCGKPRCRGLKKAVEFDIQLETEECVRGHHPAAAPAARSALLAAAGARPVEIGGAHRELEAELRKMAPPNGRTVLIFRSPCGCPKGRMEVWGAKKVRRIKK
uniref:Ribosomal protein L34e superfamily protein n=1 Tax=Leersia perrieri TaxID=77586 RepID=A0A0D9V732_9ORYZ